MQFPKQKPPNCPQEKKIWDKKKKGGGKQKTAELETISEADLTEAEQIKIITKRSRQESHISHASGSGADEGTGVAPGVPDAPDYDSEDDISWKSSDDDQDDDEQAEDDEDAGKNDINETTQDDEDDDEDDDEHDDEHDDDEKVIISSLDDEDSDDEGTNVEGAKTQEEATEIEDQGNEEVKDTNTDIDGRDIVMTDVEDTHVTLTLVNPDGQQQSSSVSSGFVSNMLNPNQDTGVDDNFFDKIQEEILSLILI
ncbi:hypothetical protein Tco_0402055 [Tanacetum coccineum]